jgi:radical SAM protein with 4Fe4S-binding SPASM domain
VDLLGDIGIKKLIIGGGEPLLIDNVFNIVERSSAIMPTHLLTNGTLINEETAGKLACCGLDGVSISLDSATPDIHNELRDGSYLSALNGIRCCINAGLNVDISTCVTTKNILAITDIIHLAEDLGAASITFQGLSPAGRGAECANLALTPEQTDLFLNNTYNIIYNKKFKIKIIMFYPQWIRWDSNAEGCEAGKNFFGLRSNGDVFPCTNLPIKIGNILEDNFADIWNCSFMNDIRMRRTGGCAVCEYLERCGGCRSKAYSLGDAFASDPSCKLAEEIAVDK